MNLLFKALVRNHSKDRGFVIPVVIALGLIMSLLGTISIFRSSDENLTASSQRATARALAAAEIGVTRYRELIDKYKVIAVYNACKTWTGNNCSDTSSDVSWFRAANIPNIAASCPTNGSTTVAAMTVRGWQYIDSTNPSLGQYRLWNYTYTSNYNTGTNTYNSQPLGTLIVEGRVNQDNTNSTEAQAAVANIEVDLPIQPGIPTPNGEIIQLEGNFNRFNPTLWITGNAEKVTNVEGLKVNGNIVVTDTNDCQLGSSPVPTTANLQTPTTQSIIIDPRQPSAKIPPSPLPAYFNTINASVINNGVTLPRSGDSSETRPNGSVYYHYSVNGAINLDGKDLNIVAGTKIILYVNGNITLTGNPDPDAGGPLLPQPVNLNFRSGNLNKSYNLEIYGASTTTDITLKGNGDINIKALIHAPNATVKIQDNPKVIINGAVWVKDWDGDSGLTTAVNISPDDTNETEVSEQYFNYTYIKNDLVDAGARVVDPVISIPSRWETKQVN